MSLDPQPTPDSPTAGNRLDRLWNATRPSAPAPAMLNALWTQAALELDRIAAEHRLGTGTPALPIRPRVVARRRWVCAGIALAQAAVVLIGVGIVLTRGAGKPTGAPRLVARGADPVPPLVAVQPVHPVSASSSARPMVDVGHDQTLIVRIDDSGHQVDLLADPSGFPSLPDSTSHDVFNALESMAAL